MTRTKRKAKPEVPAQTAAHKKAQEGTMRKDVHVYRLGIGVPRTDTKPMTVGVGNGTHISSPIVPESKQTAGANWDGWKESVLAQMDQAIERLEMQLMNTKAARAAVEAL